MDSQVILSILTPAIPERLDQVRQLCTEFQRQIENRAVEHLILIDNRRRTVGEKRDALLRASHGRFIAFVDDDDWIEPNYVSEILDASVTAPDIITFLQSSTVNGQNGTIEFKLGNPNEPFAPGGTAKRNAWHICAWRRSIAILSRFPPINYGEDWAFAAPLCAIPGLREVHIPKILHHYRHDSKLTAAPPPV